VNGGSWPSFLPDSITIVCKIFCAHCTFCSDNNVASHGREGQRVPLPQVRSGSEGGFDWQAAIFWAFVGIPLA
jgi:hypothetical protein